MQAVHHWYSESLGSEAGVPIPRIWQVQTSNEAAVWAALARRLSAVTVVDENLHRRLSV